MTSFDAFCFYYYYCCCFWQDVPLNRRRLAKQTANRIFRTGDAGKGAKLFQVSSHTEDVFNQSFPRLILILSSLDPLRSVPHRRIWWC